MGRKQEEEKEIKKKVKRKSDEQCEPKNKKILLSWLKHSQMPTVPEISMFNVTKRGTKI